MLVVSHIVPKRTKDPCYARDVSITCSGVMNCVTEQVTSPVKEKQQHQMHFLVSFLYMVKIWFPEKVNKNVVKTSMVK
jgi:hypothetical protein